MEYFLDGIDGLDGWMDGCVLPGSICRALAELPATGYATSGVSQKASFSHRIDDCGASVDYPHYLPPIFLLVRGAS